MLRFTIRDLLWLITLAAVSLGWWRYALKREAWWAEQSSASSAAIKRELQREHNEQMALVELEKNQLEIARLEAKLALLNALGSSDEQRDEAIRETREQLLDRRQAYQKRLEFYGKKK